MRTRVVLPAVIALGSNLGDREDNLRAAVADIAAIDGVTVEAASGIVESHAWKPAGVDEDAPNYLNAVLLVRSALLPEQLLDELNRIEAEHGRVRVERWGDRTLDLDIVSFGAMRITSERLTLPHPRAWERPFVIVPWLQAEPGARLPEHGPIAELAAASSDEVWPFAASPLWTPGDTV
ncbi:2-amino-4-hydroxy-6-hydroxymethyldihydropteridine diphosphokinase [Lacisediminihabitans changchengi]|uniref:2-amino-4-hydroxy-6-hydroxymethyldihydropteridine diphosphokinase n=1 Tax=Lacisediminihabitans changchengi TaxID=2787634 RepID=A0A934W5G4_9MICO|nr:2-amino-4-hydroxy-6-hydroxymethyldihydropteridine diphosphokinase [Lacisediminihabitans changchengi]MBK4348480.1 2-amino-4-hydroxy-6-hydroxymethyldihydropteridine diphosphokinase [Lacisediminihabitans changchengi]